MERNKIAKDRSVGRLILTAFVVVLILIIGWVVISQSGIIPGDVPTQQDGIGPENGV